MDEITDIQRRAGIHEETGYDPSVSYNSTENYLQEVVDLQIEIRDLAKRFAKLPMTAAREQQTAAFFKELEAYLKGSAQHASKYLSKRSRPPMAPLLRP